MTALNRDDILKVSDIKLELVSVPEWGGEVWVKGMTGAERDKYEASCILEGEGLEGTGKIDMTNLRAKLCVMTICNKDKKRIFKEKDIQALSQKSASALQRVFSVAQKLSGMSDEDIEELTEGLEKRPFDDSVSD